MLKVYEIYITALLLTGKIKVCTLTKLLKPKSYYDQLINLKLKFVLLISFFLKTLPYIYLSNGVFYGSVFIGKVM